MLEITKARLRGASYDAAELVVFFVLDRLAHIVGKRRTALFANRLQNVRYRATYLLVDAASLWISNKTQYHNCIHCFEFVIDDSLSEWHEKCHDDAEIERRLEHEEYMRAVETEEDWIEYERETEDLSELDDETVDWCSGCGHPGCDGNCELNEECPGGCRETVRHCICSELKSLAEHNANPATRGSWWTP